MLDTKSRIPYIYGSGGRRLYNSSYSCAEQNAFERVISHFGKNDFHFAAGSPGQCFSQKMHPIKKMSFWNEFIMPM